MKVRSLASLEFQSKLLMMLLVVSLGSVLTAGLIGFQTGTDAVREAEYARLTQLRESRAREIVDYFNRIEQATAILTHSDTLTNATRDFNAAFTKLQTTPLPPGATETVDRYLTTEFGPKLEQATGKQVDASLFRPTSNAQTYLQNLYTVPAKGDSEYAAKVLTAGDPSAWSASNARYQEFFADLSERFGFGDVLLLDTEGNIVYTAYNDVDLGANIHTGPFRTSKLAEVYRRAIQSTSTEEAFFTDFEHYAPSLAEPIVWVATPVADRRGIIGVLALQVESSSVTDVMTGNDGWERDGLGKTGETYLAGPDQLMRSNSRLLITDPERYGRELVSYGTPADIVEEAMRLRDSTLLQPVNTVAVKEALAGQAGVAAGTGYAGQEELWAYEPVQLPDVNWVLVAKIDKAEATAPVTAFGRKMALSTAAIVLAVCVLGLIFARVLTRPVKRLSEAVNKVSGGELGTTVPVTSSDDFGKLAEAFNGMSAGLLTKQRQIEEQQRENDELLASLMPEPVARRYRQGEETIGSHERDASIISARVQGFDAFAEALTPEESVTMLNSLIDAFNATADVHGVDKIRSLQHNGLQATCGLVVRRVDHTNRMIAFAKELAEFLERFNTQHQCRLSIHAGIDSGPVSSGLVGGQNRIYALWGEAVDLAYRVSTATTGPGVFVSDRVRVATIGMFAFSEAGTISGAKGSETVWRLDSGANEAR